MTTRKNHTNHRAARLAGALARGWTFGKRPVEDRPKLIAAITANTQRNLERLS